MYCSQSFLGGRPTETPYELQPCQADGVTGQEPGLQVGDTVRVTAAVCKGLVGELKTIDPEEPDGNHYGVALDAIEGWIFFRADELERVERWCDRCHKKTDEWREQSGEVLCEKCIRELERNARSK